MKRCQTFRRLASNCSFAVVSHIPQRHYGFRESNNDIGSHASMPSELRTISLRPSELQTGQEPEIESISCPVSEAQILTVGWVGPSPAATRRLSGLQETSPHSFTVLCATFPPLLHLVNSLPLSASHIL